LRFVIETDDRRIIGILNLRERNLERQCVARIETGIHVLQTREAFHEKPGAAEQDERKRDFGDDESVAQTITSRALARTSAAFLDHLGQFRSCSGQTGNEAKNNSSDDSN